MKVIPRLSELLEPNQYVAITNVDDFFTQFAVQGIKEIAVDRSQMLLITKWMIMNAERSSEPNIAAWKAMSEGKVDKFLGIKLKLYDT